MGARGDEFFKDFERINAPRTVVNKIKKAERYNTLWEQMNYFDIEYGERKGFVKFLKSKRDSRMKLIQKWVSKPLTYSAYGFLIIYFGITVASIVKAIVGVV